MRNHIHSLLLKFYKFHTFRQYNVSSTVSVGTATTTTEPRRYEAFTIALDYPQPYKLLFAHINRKMKNIKKANNFYNKTGRNGTGRVSESHIKMSWNEHFQAFSDLYGILTMTCPVPSLSPMRSPLSLGAVVFFCCCLIYELFQVSITSGTIQFS